MYVNIFYNDLSVKYLLQIHNGFFTSPQMVHLFTLFWMLSLLIHNQCCDLETQQDQFILFNFHLCRFGMLVNKQQREHLIFMQILTFYDLIFTLNLMKCEKGEYLTFYCVIKLS